MVNLYQIWYSKKDNKTYTKAEKATDENAAKTQVINKIDGIAEIKKIRKLGAIVDR